MQINLVYDASTTSAPAAFFSAMNYCVQYLDGLITNNITVNIEVGWGEIQGQSLDKSILGAANIEGNTISYSQLQATLLGNISSAAEASAYADLPSTDISRRGAGFLISLAQEKALGLVAANGTETDGYVGFSSSTAWNFDPNNQAVAGEYDFIGDALHELTHALGRINGLNPGWPLTVMDLFQYSSAGTLQTHTGEASYFSIDGGVTNLGDFSSTSDLADWSSTVPNDSLDAFSATGTTLAMSATDITLMNVLGFAVTPQQGWITSATVATDDSRSEVGVGHVVTITLNTDVKETVTGTPTLQLNDGEVATYVGGSGTSALQFAYTIQPGDNSANLQVTGINLTGGATILDSFDSNLSTSVTASLGVQVVTLVNNLQTTADNLVYLLYQASFARMPDYAGFEYWAGQADARHLSALQLADIFMAAPEFTAKFGANPSNDAFVTELYANVLGRTPDAGGLAYWEAQANAGQPRDQLLVAFATSAENIQTAAPHTAHGYWVS
jgi:hypothetical protein